MYLAHFQVPWPHLAQVPVPVTSLSQTGSGLTDGGDGLAVGQETKAILEDAAAVEEGEGDAHDLLQPILDSAQTGAGRVLHLVE